VLTAVAEQAPTDAVSELIGELRSRVLPLVEDTQAVLQLFTPMIKEAQSSMSSAQQLLADLQTITGRLERGEGSIGRILTTDTLARDVESLLDEARADMQRLGAILTSVEEMARYAPTLTATLDKYARDLPQVAKRVEAILGPLQKALEDLRQTTPELPRIAKNMAETTEGLPLLILQTERSLDSLEKLLGQLQSHWLLGGGRPDAVQESSKRLPVVAITP
jgi:phospholipid/cholesterol/gamma-HCH transport system substrate-binding protein